MPRVKKTLKWAAIVAGATAAVLLIAGAFLVQSTGRRLEHRLAAIRRAGEPVRIADLGRAPIPPETDADTSLRRADADLEAIEKELGAMYPRVGYPRGKPTPAEREKLEKLFAAHPRLMGLLEQAADAPDHDPKLDATLPRNRFLEACLDLSARHRPIYRVLRARSALLLAQGHLDDAARAQLLLLRLTRQWRREPMLMGYLVRVVGEYTAMEVMGQVLQAGPVAPDTRQAIEAELARHDTTDGYAHALRTERAFSLDTAREMHAGALWPLRFLTNGLMLRLLDLYDRYLEDAARPFVAVAAGRRAAPPARLGWNPYGRLATLLEPGLISALEATDRVRAMDRSLRVLNALQARAPAAADAPIPPLTDLGLPAEATVDPFDGQPLRVKKDPRGWMVYSVGANGVDDGGQVEKAADIGVGPVGPAEAAKTP